jgi:hypothetical protein
MLVLYFSEEDFHNSHTWFLEIPGRVSRHIRPRKLIFGFLYFTLSWVLFQGKTGHTRLANTFNGKN